MRSAALGLLVAVAAVAFSPVSAWASSPGGGAAKPAVVAVSQPLTAKVMAAGCHYRSPACRWTN